MPDDTESDNHRGVAAVARLDRVAPPAVPAATTSSSSSSSSCATATDTATAREDDDEDGFTFSPVAVAVAVPRLQQGADCAFPDARIGGGPVYPVFGRPRWSLPKEEQQQQDEEEGPGAARTATVRVPLRRHLLEDPWCHGAPSASGQQVQPADNADAELDGVPAETYCLWSPGVLLSPPASARSSRRASPACHRKSGSTGSPVLRWRRRRRVVIDVERNHSDGKQDRFVFLGTSSDRDAGEGHAWMNRGRAARGGGKLTTTSFLRCKQDLVELVVSAVTCRRSCYLF